MSQKLCWKCRKYFGAYSMSELTSHLHCHHPEPEEKPKCWCELKSPQFPLWKYLPGYPDKENTVLPIEINFCPECGKKSEAV